MILTRTVFLVLGAAILACRGDGGSDSDSAAGALMTFDTARVRLVSKADTIPLVVELARTTNEKTMGLMERTHLPESSGMLFIYDAMQPGTNGFWMFRTKIPLDTTATAAQCPTYNPDVPYLAALEVNGGFFAKHGIQLGDRVMLADTARR